VHPCCSGGQEQAPALVHDEGVRASLDVRAGKHHGQGVAAHVPETGTHRVLGGPLDPELHTSGLECQGPSSKQIESRCDGEGQLSLFALTWDRKRGSGFRM